MAHRERESRGTENQKEAAPVGAGLSADNQNRLQKDANRRDGQEARQIHRQQKARQRHVRQQRADEAPANQVNPLQNDNEDVMDDGFVVVEIQPTTPPPSGTVTFAPGGRALLQAALATLNEKPATPNDEVSDSTDDPIGKGDGSFVDLEDYSKKKEKNNKKRPFPR